LSTMFDEPCNIGMVKVLARHRIIDLTSIFKPKRVISLELASKIHYKLFRYRAAKNV